MVFSKKASAHRVPRLFPLSLRSKEVKLKRKKQIKASSSFILSDSLFLVLKGCTTGFLTEFSIMFTAHCINLKSFGKTLHVLVISAICNPAFNPHAR